MVDYGKKKRFNICLIISLLFLCLASCKSTRVLCNAGADEGITGDLTELHDRQTDAAVTAGKATGAAGAVAEAGGRLREGLSELDRTLDELRSTTESCTSTDKRLAELLREIYSQRTDGTNSDKVKSKNTEESNFDTVNNTGNSNLD